MLKNILLYLTVLLSVFVFSIFYYAWFSWYLLVLTLCVPVMSLVFCLPFMIYDAVNGVSVFVEDEVNAGDELYIAISGRNKKRLFCPLMKTKFKITNSFTGQKSSLKFLYSGYLKDPVYRKADKCTQNCGCLEIKATYLKIYDMLGIFFIPVKLRFNSEVLVMPKSEKPSVLPDSDHIKIIGYKPNTSGFVEDYELRNYQEGDSLKNIHWKISARYDELIIKEPSVPVYRPLVIKPVITESIAQNNKTLGKLLYASDFLIESKRTFFCELSDNKIYEVRSKDDVKDLLLMLYKNTFPAQSSMCEENVVVYTITHNTEAVSA